MILLNEVIKSTSQFGRVSRPLGLATKHIRQVVAIEGMPSTYTAPLGTMSVVETQQGKLFNVAETVKSITEMINQ